MCYTTRGGGIREAMDAVQDRLGPHQTDDGKEEEMEEKGGGGSGRKMTEETKQRRVALAGFRSGEAAVKTSQDKGKPDHGRDGRRCRGITTGSPRNEGQSVRGGPSSLPASRRGPVARRRFGERGCRKQAAV